MAYLLLHLKHPLNFSYLHSIFSLANFFPTAILDAYTDDSRIFQVKLALGLFQDESKMQSFTLRLQTD